MPLFNFNQNQQCGVSAVLFWCLMKRHNMRVLGQPQRRLLFENMLSMPVHHAGAEYVLATAGGNLGSQFLLGLLLG